MTIATRCRSPSARSAPAVQRLEVAVRSSVYTIGEYGAARHAPATIADLLGERGIPLSCRGQENCAEKVRAYVLAGGGISVHIDTLDREGVGGISCVVSYRAGVGEERRQEAYEAICEVMQRAYGTPLPSPLARALPGTFGSGEFAAALARSSRESKGPAGQGVGALLPSAPESESQAYVPARRFGKRRNS